MVTKEKESDCMKENNIDRKITSKRNRWLASFFLKFYPTQYLTSLLSKVAHDSYVCGNIVWPKTYLNIPISL